MERYETDLYSVIYSRTLNPLLIKLYLYQMLRAVNYIHSFNICHRDIKPDNFMVKGFRVFLGDFGSAKRIDGNSDKNVTYIFERYYRAPELLLDCWDYDKSVDIWALGCVAAEMMREKVLFNGESALDQLVKIMRVVECSDWKKLSFLKKQGRKVPHLPEFKCGEMESQFDNRTDPRFISLIKKMLQL